MRGRLTHPVLVAAMLLAVNAAAIGQEVKFVEIPDTPRTQLRFPPAPPPDCSNGKSCVAGGFGGGSIADGAPDHRDPHALALYLVSIHPETIDPKQPVTAEFRLVNSGLADIEVPVSPHLADLQPANEAEDFDYQSVHLGVTAMNSGQGINRLLGHASLSLYGSSQHPETMLTLKPGQSLRVRGRLQWSSYPGETLDAQLEPVFNLRTNTYRPHPGGNSWDARNLYPNVTPTPAVPVRFTKPGAATTKADHP